VVNTTGIVASDLTCSIEQAQARRRLLSVSYMCSAWAVPSKSKHLEVNASEFHSSVVAEVEEVIGTSVVAELTPDAPVTKPDNLAEQEAEKAAEQEAEKAAEQEGGAPGALAKDPAFQDPANQDTAMGGGLIFFLVLLGVGIVGFGGHFLWSKYIGESDQVKPKAKVDPANTSDEVKA